MARTYDIHWVGGDRDGELLAQVDENEKNADLIAERLADELLEKHKDEFHPTWGGIGITNPDGTDHEW